jgi:hypothetical protein
MQVPMPFTRFDGYFGPAMVSKEGESVEAFSLRIQNQLNELERKHDPEEAVNTVIDASEARDPMRRPLAA